jgi:glutamate--cysteine ligase
LYERLEKRLNLLQQSGLYRLLNESRIGLEKESLRVSSEGTLAVTPHPAILGSALTHPNITTDYSEAMLEFITEPYSRIEDALKRLEQIHQFVHRRLDEEILWATSMPCVIHGDNSIPIARYGSSNRGMMKTVYRRGLGHRYGRPMQVISGIHFNYSLPHHFWDAWQKQEGAAGSAQAFRSEGYFGLTRNLQRYGWLVPYLFGASPAVCKSFVDPGAHQFQDFNENTFYDPNATSLRLGDIGYTNKREHETGINVNYDNLENYVDTLTWAIETPCDEYQKIGIEQDGQYQQLNANILQIENEYYSTVRPKQPLVDLEKPTLALRARGVEYVELRSLDINIYEPLGINAEQLHFLELLMVFCLLQDSPVVSAEGHEENDHNLLAAAHYGRDPDLKLRRNGADISLRDWAQEILEVMEGISQLLDGGGNGPYGRALKRYRETVADPQSTPSACMLKDMRERGEGFYHFSKFMSQQHHEHFLSLPVDEEIEAAFSAEAEASIQRQLEIEAEETEPFGTFLDNYFTQQ